MLQSLANRLKALVNNRKEIRYLLSGSTSELIEIGSFVALFHFTDWLYISNSISYILGVVSGFLFHKLWSFKGEHQFKTRSQFIGYVSLAGFNFVMINILLGIYVEKLHFMPFVGKVAAIITTLTWTYVLTNKVIFRHKKSTE